MRRARGSTGAPPARQIAGLRALRYAGPGMSEASADQALGPARDAFHYIAVEGPIGVGKTSVVERLAERLEAARCSRSGARTRS